MMKKRPLGNTEIEVSEVAFGGVEIGIPYGIGVESAKDMLSEQKAIELLHAAFSSGINFFDTARMYGTSENIIGKAFKNQRDEVVIATKCHHFLDEKGNLPSSDVLKGIILKSLHESLEALQTDYVDVFMLHQGTIPIVESKEIADIFLNLKSVGKIKAMGISTYLPEETERAIDAGIWNVIQIPFNLMEQRQSAFFQSAKEKGIALVVRSVLLKGLLSDRGKNLHPELKKVEEHILQFNELLEGESYNLATLATKFALSFNEVSSVLVGMDRMEYLEKTLHAADGNYLNETKMAKAKQLAYPDPEFLNLPYWDKMNWLR